MIQAKDLRVNNHILYQSKVWEINGIDGAGDEVDLYNGDHITGVDIEDIQPIPLTKEVLEACGFKPNGKGSHLYFLNGLRFTFPQNYCTILRDCDKAGESQAFCCGKSLGDKVQISYLHQLQNLYHALTGEELIYQPLNKNN